MIYYCARCGKPIPQGKEMMEKIGGRLVPTHMDCIPKETEDDPPAEEESGMAKRISKRGKPEAADDPSVEK